MAKINGDTWAIWQRLDYYTNKLLSLLGSAGHDISVVGADLQCDPGNSLAHLDRLVLEHGKELIAALLDKRGEGWLVGTIGDRTESDQGSIAFLPLSVHDVHLDESYDGGKDLAAE